MMLIQIWIASLSSIISQTDEQNNAATVHRMRGKLQSYTAHFSLEVNIINLFACIALFIHHLIPYNENEKDKCRCQNHPGSGRRAVTGDDSYTHSEALPLLHRESPAQCCCRSEGAL